MPEQVGPPLDLLHNPRTEFVADFLGSPSMGIVDVTTRNGLVMLVDLPLTRYQGPALVTRCGIRPEHIKSDHRFDALVLASCDAKRIVLHGVRREGLMMRALAMRLYHLGLNAHVLGDMTTPPVGIGDLLVVSAGPGYFSSVAAICNTAKHAGAVVACINAQINGSVPGKSDLTLLLPAQTMANDQSESTDTSVLPMGSLYEGTLYIAFELVVLAVREHIGSDFEAMRARHTNLE